MGATSPTLGVDRMQQRMEESEVALNRMQNVFESLIQGSVKSRAITAQPGSPANGDRYILPTGPTGAVWSTFTAGRIAIYYDGWSQLTPKEGWRVWVDDEDCFVDHDGSAGAAGWVGGSVMGITATNPPAQGSGALTADYNEVTTVTAANDCVTLPVARRSRRIVIVNRGANVLQVFPASGDSINNGAVDASITIAVNGAYVFYAFNATKWYTVVS